MAIKPVKASTRGIDLIGRTFGNLKVVAKTDKRKHRAVVWSCNCSCGTKAFEVTTQQLMKGETKGCGCLRGRNPKNRANQRFGKLIALYPTQERKWNSVLWHCLCDCGKTKDVPMQQLVGKHVSSCGCKKRGPIPNKLLT